jgi:nucleotide-binding universal stress UspA family protein
MLVVGPAVLALSDPTNTHVSVFTQTMDQLLPAPLPYVGTAVGIVVLGSAAAASAQGLQNLALGLRYRNYIPASFGLRNRFDVADKPVWLEVALVSICYLAFGTNEETYLAIYAAGVFILLSMTGWAAAKRLTRHLRTEFSGSTLATLVGTTLAALLTTAATVIIFEERFFEGAWTYFLFIPILYVVLTHFRSRLGKPLPLDEHLGRFFVGQYLLPYQRQARPVDEIIFDDVVVPLDGSSFAEHAIPIAEVLAHTSTGRMELVGVTRDTDRDDAQRQQERKEEAALAQSAKGLEDYLRQMAWSLGKGGVEVHYTVRSGSIATEIDRLARDVRADIIVMSTHGRSSVERMLRGSVADGVVRRSDIPVLMIRPREEWTSRASQFRRLLVSLDGSESAESVLPYVRAMARHFGSEVLLLAVPEGEGEVARLEHYLHNVTQALQARGIEVKAMVTGSGAARTIIATSQSEPVDLIMMATRGRGSLAAHDSVGSVAERVVQAAPCPVFVVPVRTSRVIRTAPEGVEDLSALKGTK